MREIGTNKTHRFITVSPFEKINSLKGLFVKDIAADTVNRIGRVGNNAPLFQDIDNPVYEPFLRIIRIDMN